MDLSGTVSVHFFIYHFVQDVAGKRIQLAGIDTNPLKPSCTLPVNLCLSMIGILAFINIGSRSDLTNSRSAFSALSVFLTWILSQISRYLSAIKNIHVVVINRAKTC